MDISRYKYRSTFASVAKVIVAPSQDKFLSKASLAPLKGIVPNDIELDSEDLLYFAANGAVAGMRNLNGDSLNPITAIAINKSAKNKYIDLDHDRDKICGCVLYPGFSKFGSNEPLDEAQAATLSEPFNMSVVGVVWKAANPMVAKYIYKMDGSLDEDALSLSWEIAFSSYDIGVGGDNVFEAKIVTPTDPAFAEYNKMLRAEGGSGKDLAGNNVFRIIRGDEQDGDPIILGYGIVARPAAAVKGILPLGTSEDTEDSTASVELPIILSNELSPELQSLFDEKPESGLGYHLCDITMKDGTIHANVAVLNHRILPENITASDVLSLSFCEKVQEKSITPSNDGVTSNTLSIAMEIKSLEQLKTEWTEIRKQESSASVEGLIAQIEKGSKEYVNQLEAEKSRAASLEQAKAALEQKTKELEKSVAEIQKQLDEVRAQAETAEAQTKFNERMASFDEKFDLDEEDRRLIAEDVRALESDDAFAAYQKKQDKLLAAKKKGMKKNDEKPGGKSNDKEPDDDGDDMDMEAAVASIKEDPNQAKIPNGNEPVDDSIRAKMASAFGTALKVEKSNGTAVTSK